MSVHLRILLWSLLLLIWSQDLVSGVAAFGWLVLTYLLTGGHHTLYLAWHTAPRDMRQVYVDLLSKKQV